MSDIRDRSSTGKFARTADNPVLSLENKTLVAKRRQQLHVHEHPSLFVEKDEKVWIAAHYTFRYSEEFTLHKLLVRVKTKFYSWEFINPGMNLNNRFQILDWRPSDYPTSGPTDETIRFRMPRRL